MMMSRQGWFGVWTRTAMLVGGGILLAGCHLQDFDQPGGAWTTASPFPPPPGPQESDVSTQRLGVPAGPNSPDMTPVMLVNYDDPAAQDPEVKKDSPAGMIGGMHYEGPSPAPRELEKVILPAYRIEPPDILQIDAIHLIPKPPYRLRTLDSVVITVPGELPDAPVSGVHQIEPGGVIDLGARYGKLKVSGLTVEEVKPALEKVLSKDLEKPEATVMLGDIAAKQQITGPHLVGPDGTVTLGSYGSVSVVGRTIAQTKETVEKHLSKFLDEPEVSVNVVSYNSKVFYVISQGAGQGDGMTRFPITGNETVLDAMTLVNGTTQASSKKVWIARPGRNSHGCSQLLPVDLLAVTQCGDFETNYQLMPGDRVYIAEDRWVSFDTALGKFLAPAERVLGFTSLATSSARGIHFFNRRGSGTISFGP